MGVQLLPALPANRPFANMEEMQAALVAAAAHIDGLHGVVNAQAIVIEVLRQTQATGAVLGPYTVETLPTPNAARLLKLADVTNLFGNRTSRVRCEKVAGATPAQDLYFWQPMSSDSSGVMPVTANMALLPLATPTTIDLTGAIGANITRTVTLATTGGWPGCVKEFRSDLTYGLGGLLNIAGTGLGSAVSLALGGYRRFVLEWNGSALAWRQIF